MVHTMARTVALISKLFMCSAFCHVKVCALNTVLTPQAHRAFVEDKRSTSARPAIGSTTAMTWKTLYQIFAIWRTATGLHAGQNSLGLGASYFLVDVGLLKIRD